MNRLVMLFAVCIAFFGISVTRAQDDPVARKLDDAKAAFEKEQAKLRDELTAALKKKSDEARSAGDLKLLERLRGEADAWEMKGELPKLVSTRSYEETLRLV